MGAEAQKFLLEINKFLPQYDADKVNEDRGNIGRLVAKNFKGKPLLPTMREAEKFFKTFEKSNEKVRKKWFPEKKELFQVDFEKYPEKKDMIKDDIENKYAFAFEVFAKLWSEKQKQINKLEEKFKTKKQIPEQIASQQSKLAQMIFNREQYEKQIVSENKYSFAFEVFAKLWSEKQNELRQLKEKIKRIRYQNR